MVIVISVFAGVANAQTNDTSIDSLLFTGQVFDRTTREPLPKAVYMIGGRTYVTDELGAFRFSAAEGDTVMFHNIGYKDIFLMVDDSLSNEEFLTGIFLSQDEVELSEVLVVPRHYSLETLVKSTPTDARNLKIAEQNMKMSAYQALLPNTNWDAETNQKYAIQKEAMKVEYKGMVAPDRFFGANLTTVVPEVKLTYGSAEESTLDLGAISTEERKYLQTVFQIIQSERLKQQDSIPQRIQPPLKQIK